MHLETLSLALLASATATLAAPNGTKPYSTWMASSFLSKGQKPNNHYVQSIVQEAIQKAGTTQKDASLISYASKTVSSLVKADGKITGWDPTFYSLDDVRFGNNILYFWNAEGRKEKKYEIAAKGLRDQLDRWPRTPKGGFWHRAPIYKNQMWLDGIYMADTFYATYTSYFEPNNMTAWSDITLQFDLVEEHCRNHTSNLLQHGYSEDKSTVWADPVTGASPLVWNRAVGWYFVALVEVLEIFPKSHPGFAKLQGYLTTLADGLKKAQDASGGWWLIMNEPYPGMKGNYIESSATAMFSYGYLKGIRLGLLDAAYKTTALKAWDLMIDEFVQYEKNGTLSWTGTVEVGSLKGDASYEYYVGVPLALNDGKGAAPFMYTATEIELAGL